MDKEKIKAYVDAIGYDWNTIQSQLSKRVKNEYPNLTLNQFIEKHKEENGSNVVGNNTNQLNTNGNNNSIPRIDLE